MVHICSYIHYIIVISCHLICSYSWIIAVHMRRVLKLYCTNCLVTTILRDNYSSSFQVRTWSNNSVTFVQYLVTYIRNWRLYVIFYIISQCFHFIVAVSSVSYCSIVSVGTCIVSSLWWTRKYDIPTDNPV